MHLTKNFDGQAPENKYYLYRHVRLDNNKPFYIGIGTKKNNFNTPATEYSRAYNHNARTMHWKNTANKYGCRVDIMFESNDYEYIKQQEIEFIALYKRRELFKDGLLINKTNGGEGTHGRVFKHSEKTRLYLSELGKNKKISPEHLRKLNEGKRNYIVTDEVRQKMSMSFRGRKVTEEHRKKNSMAKTGGNHPKARKIQNIEDGKIYGCMKDACAAYGLHYTTFMKYINNKIKCRKYDAHKKFSFV